MHLNARGKSRLADQIIKAVKDIDTNGERSVKEKYRAGAAERICHHLAMSHLRETASYQYQTSTYDWNLCNKL